jgi:hypothetical protein
MAGIRAWWRRFVLFRLSDNGKVKKILQEKTSAPVHSVVHKKCIFAGCRKKKKRVFERNYSVHIQKFFQN